MGKKKPEADPFQYGRKFKNEGPPPGAFPVKDPHVLKGIKDSVKSMEKGRAQAPRFKAWGKGIDYDAIEGSKE